MGAPWAMNQLHAEQPLIFKDKGGIRHKRGTVPQYGEKGKRHPLLQAASNNTGEVDDDNLKASVPSEKEGSRLSPNRKATCSPLGYPRHRNRTIKADQAPPG